MSPRPKPILAALALILATSNSVAEAAAPEATTAGRPSNRGAVGRKIYTVPRDLADGGSASDMLRTLPFVEIDAEGEVSLRGKRDVVILLDGHASIELSAEWRAFALQRMPAGMIESVEIITGVSAQFPSGGAGVINIVTRKARKPQD
jgi:outer membrane cobalamin receptor